MKIAIIALAAATAIAGAAQAQGYYGQGYYGQGYDNAYGNPRGDYYARTAGWDYPEFRNISWHIRSEIQQGLREGWLDGDRAGDFRRQLRDIQIREQAEYREHGAGLPQWDRDALRDRFDHLDRALDWTRERAGGEGRGAYGYGYGYGGR